MCSSPAYPTSTPLGGSMTGGRAAVGGQATARRNDAADISSKGLLPQLIDVLRALTEGQVSLARRVRDARLECTCHSAPDVERYTQAEASDFAAPRSFVGTSPKTSLEIRREPPTDNVELTAGPRSDDGNGNGSLPEPSIGVSSAPVSVAISEATSPTPSNPPAPIVTRADTPADPSSDTSAQTDWLNSAWPDETTTAPSNRDYNFFDELDARLADLQGPADRSGDL